MDINVNLQINEEDRKKTEAILMEIQDIDIPINTCIFTQSVV